MDRRLILRDPSFRWDDSVKKHLKSNRFGYSLLGFVAAVFDFGGFVFRFSLNFRLTCRLRFAFVAKVGHIPASAF